MFQKTDVRENTFLRDGVGTDSPNQGAEIFWDAQWV